MTSDDSDHIGDYVPFSKLRRHDIPAEMRITRQIFDSLATLVEAGGGTALPIQFLRLEVALGLCINGIKELEQRNLST